jgi:hypothetical protein
MGDYMIGKLIIFAIVGVIGYALYLRIKARISGQPVASGRQLKDTSHPAKGGVLGGDVRIRKLHLIITGLALLYLVWAVITLYR